MFSGEVLTEYQALCGRNMDTPIYSCYDIRFKNYGRLWNEFDLTDVMAWAKTITVPEDSNLYIPSSESAEKLSPVQAIGSAIYGGQPFQAGPCCGNNQILSGIEYHNGSEAAICITSCVMFLGQLRDMHNNTYDSAKAEAFYFPAGTVVQTYETTLHYTPCAVNGTFFTVCFLPRGTGTPLPNGPQGILKKQNKWFVAHPDNVAKIQAGDFPGLLGIERKIL